MVMRKSSGFSLIEILVVVAIIGLLLATMGPKLMDQFARGKKGAAKTQLVAIKDAIVQYSMDLNRPPKTREGLQVLRENVNKNPKWQGPYLSKDPEDPWGEMYQYNSPPEHFKKEYKRFEVYSYGENGEGSEQNEWIHDGA